MSDYIKTVNIQQSINRRDRIIKKVCISINSLVLISILYFIFYVVEFNINWFLILFHSIVVFIGTFANTKNRLILLINPRAAMLNRLMINNNFLKLDGEFLDFKGSYNDYLKKVEESQILATIEIGNEINWEKLTKAAHNIWLNSFVIILMIFISLVGIFIPILILDSIDHQMVLAIYLFSYFWRASLVLAIDMTLIIFETKKLILKRDILSIYLYTRSYYITVFNNGFWNLFALEIFLYDFDKLVSNRISFTIDDEKKDDQ